MVGSVGDHACASGPGNQLILDDVTLTFLFGAEIGVMCPDGAEWPR